MGERRRHDAHGFDLVAAICARDAVEEFARFREDESVDEVGPSFSFGREW